MRYDPNNFDHKMRVLELATRFVGKNTLGSEARWNAIKSMVMSIEEELKSAPTPRVLTEVDERKAFLDSISTTCCGNGRDDCDGSEGTCTCQ